MANTRTLAQQSCQQQPFHVTLCALAEYYLRAAARSAPRIYFGRQQDGGRAGRRLDEFRCYIFAALRALTTVLTLTTSPTHVLAEAHFKIAEILFENTEDLRQVGEHLSKSFVLATKQGANMELKVRIADLQVRLLQREGDVKRAKRVLDDAVDEVKESGNMPWMYRLMIRKAVIAFDHEGDERAGHALLSSVIKTAEERGDKDLRALLLLTRAWYAMVGHEFTTARQCLDELKEFFVGGNFSGTVGSLNCNRHFRLHYLLFSVILTAHTLPTKAPDEQLAEAHKLADQGDADVFGKDGWIEVALKPASTASGASEPTFLQVRWLSESQLLLLAYLVSGLSRRHDSGSAKAINYSREGLKVGYGRHFLHLSLYPARSRPDALLTVVSARRLAVCLRARLFLQVTRSSLLRWELRNSRDTFCRLVVHLASYPSLLDSLLPELAVTYGHLMQAYGRFSDAAACFQLLANWGERENPTSGSGWGLKPRRTDHRDLVIDSSRNALNGKHHRFNAILATLGMVCALQGVNNIPDRAAKVRAILERVLCEVDSTARAVETLRAAALLLKGVLDDQGLLEKKQHILMSLKLSTSQNNFQLQTIALTTLGDIYHLTQDRQAEKMLTAGYIIACKSASRMFAHLSGNLLADHYRLQRQEEDYSKQCARNKAHQEEVTNIFTLLQDYPLK